MAIDKIVIKGARENNLKNIDLEIPRDKFIVLTGVSGSGKSSLAFETIYAEGQRRYVESLSSYARQFLGQMEKPNVDSIEGLSPAISIDQKTTNHNPRSTVGTVTEIYDYLRLLYARIGVPHCHKCGKEIKGQTIDQIVDQVLKIETGSKIQLLAPIVKGKKGEHLKVLEEAKKNGYLRIRVDGEIRDLAEDIKLTKTKKHTIEVVVDRLVIKEGIQKRLTESIENVMTLSSGVLVVNINFEKDIMFSQNFSCLDCGVSIEEIEPRSFSFNNPIGACPVCLGLGKEMKFNLDMMIDKEKSLLDGAISVMGFKSISKKSGFTYNLFEGLAKKYNIDLNIKFKDLSDEIKEVIINGDKKGKIEVVYTNKDGTNKYMYRYEGIINTVQRRYKETSSEKSRRNAEQYMTEEKCTACNGDRLKSEILAVTVADKSIASITSMAIKDAKTFFKDLTLNKTDEIIAQPILKEVNARLGFLSNVGLGYLSLSRGASTLSGGESQRIRLATQIGSGLVGVVYILDEPSIGLHQRDNDRLLKTLENLKNLGNTLIVVEHDSDTMLACDYIIDIGPRAGEHGGEVVYAGDVAGILEDKNSITGKYLSKKIEIEIPKIRRKKTKEVIRIVGASENNLKNVKVDIPLGILTCVTGVSGSGKSSLINQILYKRLAKELNRAKTVPGKHKSMKGFENLDKIINIDQGPIGRTPRSNPTTYTGAFDLIRDLFATTNDAKIRGYNKGRFSFNVSGGRCEACKGDGILKIEMHFLPDVYVPCEVCKGKRYNRETLEVKYKEKNIYDVLQMTVSEALKFFENLPRIYKILKSLNDVGLSYIKLGQPSTTLSGGEAQRVKLATELCKRSTGKTIYILDEPTTGLHAYDVHKLTEILQKLTDGGNTVVVIEHNLDIIKIADYIIDIGAEGGDEGGEILVVGTPEKVAKCEKSYTGKYLKKILGSIN